MKACSVCSGLLFFSLVCTAFPARADEVYLTKDEALEIILGKDCEIKYEKRTLDEATLSELKKIDAAPDRTGSAESHIFTCFRQGRAEGYAFIDQQVGKHAPITFIVGISPSGTVTGAEIMVYREHYGSQVKGQEFLSQFEGKSVSDGLRIGKDVKHITGATLSSLAIAKGVRRELMLWKLFFPRSDSA